MGRLISADYAKEHMRACELNGKQWHCMELDERLAVIDEVPTVDAIPVIWLKKLSVTAQSDEACEMINEIIARWEARKK